MVLYEKNIIHWVVNLAWRCIREDSKLGEGGGPLKYKFDKYLLTYKNYIIFRKLSNKI